MKGNFYVVIPESKLSPWYTSFKTVFQLMSYRVTPNKVINIYNYNYTQFFTFAVLNVQSKSNKLVGQKFFRI